MCGRSSPGSAGKRQANSCRPATPCAWASLDVVLISDGVLPLPTSTMSTNVGEAERNAWFDSRFLQRDMFDWALNIALVRSGDRLILIDSGVGDGFEYFTRAGRAVMRLESAGIDLAAITDIVITHMHMDHVGGLNVAGVKARLRPDVRIHVSARKWRSGRIRTSARR